MKLWHANLGRGVTAAEFTRNLEAILKAGGRRAVYAFQEIDEADQPEERAILEELTGDTHRMIGARTAVPILVPHRLPVLDWRITHGCDGLAKVTPNRPIVEVVLELPSGLEVAGLNFHLPILRPSTLTRRAQVRRVARERMAEHVAAGRAGWWVADTNTRRGWPRMARAEVTVTAAGIDRAKAWAPPGRSVLVTSPASVDLTIDGHNAHGRTVHFPKARR